MQYSTANVICRHDSILYQCVQSIHLYYSLGSFKIFLEKMFDERLCLIHSILVFG